MTVQDTRIHSRGLGQRGIDVNNMYETSNHHRPASHRYCAHPTEYKVRNFQITGHFEQLSHFTLMRL